MAADKDRGGPGSASAEISKYLDILAKDPNSGLCPLARPTARRDCSMTRSRRPSRARYTPTTSGHVALGRAYFEKKQFADAAAEMQKVVKSAPDNIIAHWSSADRVRPERSPGAEKAFDGLLLDPWDQEAQTAIASAVAVC
jgi:hypothetical protein